MTISLLNGERHRRCGKCNEFWPDTEEFFYWNKARDGFRSPCKACIAEKRDLTNMIAPCCIPGCNNPRYQRRSGRHDSRCFEHRYHAGVNRDLQGRRGKIGYTP